MWSRSYARGVKVVGCLATQNGKGARNWSLEISPANLMCLNGTPESNISPKGLMPLFWETTHLKAHSSIPSSIHFIRIASSIFFIYIFEQTFFSYWRPTIDVDLSEVCAFCAYKKSSYDIIWSSFLSLHFTQLHGLFHSFHMILLWMFVFLIVSSSVASATMSNHITN